MANQKEIATNQKGQNIRQLTQPTSQQSPKKKKKKKEIDKNSNI